MARSQYEINPKHLMTAGKAFTMLGTGLLITEVILGLFALDIAILICMMREDKRSQYRASSSNRFLTGYLWGQMSRQNYSLSPPSLLGIVLGSFAQSLIAGVLLTVEFGMPMIAIGVLAAWLGSLLLLVAGDALTKYANQLSLVAQTAGTPAHVVLPNDYNAQLPEPSAPPMYYNEPNFGSACSI